MFAVIDGIKYTTRSGIVSIGTQPSNLVCANILSRVNACIVKEIRGKAFGYCNSLTSVVIPKSITKIGEAVFANCKLLSYITFEGTVEEWKAIEKSENWFGVDTITKVICSNGEVPIE